MHQFSDKTNNFDFLGPNLPKNGFWGRNFKNLSLDSESIFSQNGKLLIFWPKFGEIAQLRAIFWFKYCWGCIAESWVETEMNWVEVDGAGWSYVEVGARFIIPIPKKFFKIGVLKIFPKFTGKHLCRGFIIFEDFIIKWLQHWCFLVDFGNSLKTYILWNTWERLVLTVDLFLEVFLKFQKIFKSTSEQMLLILLRFWREAYTSSLIKKLL